jgi:hypothetical protein
MLIIKANKLYEFMILIIRYVRSLVDWHEGVWPARLGDIH